MTEFIDPKQFIISRKRKKYRFAKFHNAANCFEFADWSKAPADIVEIGAGTGMFSVDLAARYPQKTIVALDVKADRLQKGAYTALERGLTNVYFVRARADQLTELFTAQSVGALWLTFSDPFPRERSAGRRLTHSNYLHKYAQVLAAGGVLAVKHDNPAFFNWSLEQVVKNNWHLTELSFDLHKSDLSSDYKIMTTYEERWLGENRQTHFFRAQVPS